MKLSERMREMRKTARWLLGQPGPSFGQAWQDAIKDLVALASDIPEDLPGMDEPTSHRDLFRELIAEEIRAVIAEADRTNRDLAIRLVKLEDWRWQMLGGRR